MGFVRRITTIFLVVFCALGMSFPVMAALRDYGIYLGSIGGSTLLRLDNTLTKDDDRKIEENKLTSTTALRTKGFIWDPRFMTVDLGFQYSSNKTETDTSSYSGDAIGFNFKSVLFPRWRYPYLPIRMAASKVTRTIGSYGGGEYETDYSRVSLNWGLLQKQLGRVRMRYAYTLEESTGEAREQDIVRNRLQVNASKDFLKNKWGETHLGYGYHFDSYDDRVEGQSDMQHHLFTNNTSKFGKKANLNSNVLFYQRYYEGRDDALDEDYFFSSNADLRVRQTERFQHSYRLGLVSDNRSSNYSGSANAIYTYIHDLNEYLKSTVSAGATARYDGGSDPNSAMQFDTNVNGMLVYLRVYDTFRSDARYNLSVRSPSWRSGGVSQGIQSDVVRINQTASLRFSRKDNPLYSDAISFQARHLIAEEDSYSYSANYSATSKYAYSSKASSLISGNAAASQSNITQSTVGFGSSAVLRYRFGRNARTSIDGRQKWRVQGGRVYSLLGIRGRFSGRLYRRFDVRFSTELGWTRRIEEIRGGDTFPIDRINGSAEVSSSMGRLVMLLRYNYRETDVDGDVTADQLIMLQIKRYFGWRL